MSTHGLDVWAYTLPLARSGEFVLGIALAFAVSRSSRRETELSLPRIPLPVALAFAAGSATLITVAQPGQFPASLLTMPAFACVIVAAAQRDLARKRGLLGTASMVHLGEISFAFYLVHELFLINVRRVLPVPSGHALRAAYFAALVLAALVLAEALHQAIERPAQRWLRAHPPRWARPRQR